MFGTTTYPDPGTVRDTSHVRLRSYEDSRIDINNEGEIEGRVEVLAGSGDSQFWGTIAQSPIESLDRWDNSDAQVVCRVLATEYGGVASLAWEMDPDEIEDAPNWIPMAWWNVDCDGDETKITDCQKTDYPDPTPSNPLDHSLDVGVYCQIEIPQSCVQCVAGKYNAGTGLEFCQNCVLGKYSAVGSIAQDNCAECAQGKKGRENPDGVPYCEDCQDNASSSADRLSCPCDPGYEDMSLSGIHLPDTQNIRLRVLDSVDPVTPIFDHEETVEGRIEVKGTDGGWGTIRATNANPWDNTNAMVACREIAVANGYFYISGSAIGPGETPEADLAGTTFPQYYEQYACDGNELQLDSCSKQQTTGPAQHDKAVGISCSFYKPEYLGVCRLCSEGKYSDTSGMPCTPCEAGSYAAGTASHSCSDCATGKKSDVVGADSESVCQNCHAGTYSGSMPGSDSCESCPEGQFSLEGSAGCTLCNLGKYSEGSASTCTDCDDREFQPLTGKGSCNPCNAPLVVDVSRTQCSCPLGSADVYPSGRIADAGTIRIRDQSNLAPEFSETGFVEGRVEVMPSGKANFGTISNAVEPWTDTAAFVACRQLGDALGYMMRSGTAVPPGATPDGPSTIQWWNSIECRLLYSAPTRDTACQIGYDCSSGLAVPCLAGRWSDGVNACMDCPIGSRCLGAATHSQCQPGKYQHQTGQKTCIVCPAGKYQDERGQSGCTDCSIGKYNNNDGTKRDKHDNSNNCEECVAGKYGPSEGAVTCTACPAGKSVIVGGLHISADQCVVCGTGKYANEGSACLSCPAGTYLSDAGTNEKDHDDAKDCAICEIGTYQNNPESSGCIICPAGTYNNDHAYAAIHHDSINDCIICPAGTYNSDAATSAVHHNDLSDCAVCPSGTYLPDEATSAEFHTSIDLCTACAVGKKNKDAGTAAEFHDSPNDCSNCDPNYYSDLMTGTSSCTACPEGEFSVGGSSQCSDCPPGFTCKYDTEGNLESTAPCLTGTYSQGGGECVQCEPGYRCPGGTNHMYCNQGEHQPASGQSICLPCASGTYQSLPGQTECLECPEGYFCPTQTVNPIECGSKSSFCVAGSPNPYLAPIGKYTMPELEDKETMRVEAAFCPSGSACIGGVKTKCEAGLTFQPNAGKSSCKTCSVCGAGKFIYNECTEHTDRVCRDCRGGTASLGGATKCDQCVEGQPTNNETGASICTTCPQYEELDLDLGYSVRACKCAISFVRKQHNESCSCLPGFTLTGEACSPCEEGRFKEDYGVHSCSRCEDVLKNSVTINKNSTVASECVCPEAKYDNLLTGKDRMCVPVKKGMSLDTSGMSLTTVTMEPGYWRVGPQSIDIRQCPIEAACVGGNISAANGYCRGGHRGPYCNLCMKEYTKDPFHLCQTCDSTTADLVYSILTIFTIMIIIGLILGCAHKKHFGANTNYDRKKLSKRFKNGFKIIFTGAQITSALPAVIPVLALPQNFKSIVQAAQFLNLNVFQFVAVGCWSKNFNFYNRLIGTTLPIIAICLLLTTFAQLIPSRKARLNNIAVAITYLTLPTVTTTIFAMFPCDSIDGGQSYLRADYSIDCNAENRWVWQAYGASMIVVFPLGITLLYCRLLWVDRKKIMLPIEEREKDFELMAEAFLFEPYKPEFWYFEVIETVRRLCLTGVLSAVKPGSFSQLSIGLLMCIFFTTVFCKLEPYHESRDNKIAILSSWQLVLVFLCSSFMKSATLLSNSVDDTADFEGMGYILIFSFIAIFILFVVYAIEQKDDISEDAEDIAERILAEQSKSQMKISFGSLGSIGSMGSLRNMGVNPMRTVSEVEGGGGEGFEGGGDGMKMTRLRGEKGGGGGGGGKGGRGGGGRGRGRGGGRGGSGSGIWKSTPQQNTVVGKPGMLETIRASLVNEEDENEKKEVVPVPVGPPLPLMAQSKNSNVPHDPSILKARREEAFFAAQREKARQEKEEEAKNLSQMSMLEREKYEKEMLEKNKHSQQKSQHMQRLSMTYRGGAAGGKGEGRWKGRGRGRGGGK
ncbi:hypothetical protein TL16_g05623 [Triparma laevis f. inornata]|uniref:Uncharacterized protein n=1 Tax=Triparma laevis f. inornata TaxID=1714386 RepID=A0A9W7AK01_9STRA|nr:hypothetical protein TL16_g05623 [Triparma laevis f. inornata]